MEDLSDRTLSITKTFNAPLELLWKVLTTPEHIVYWWGPDGFTNTIEKMEVKVGGKWEFIMHGPDGTEYVNKYTYSKIEPNKEIVLAHLATPKFTIIISLSQEGEKTQVKWQNIFDSVPSKEEAVRAFKADEGLRQNLEKLANYLQEQVV
ncbi:MAG: polyketide cyclase [Thalassobius sp.]|nr:polyketide cyclase [Thalassovita sp.]